MAYREERLELRSSPPDDVIREGLTAAFAGFVRAVTAAILLGVPAITVVYWLAYDGLLVRVALAAVVVGLGVWSVRRARRELVRAALADRTGREVVLVLDGAMLVAAERNVPRGTLSVLVTPRAVVVRGKGLPPQVLARGDVPDDALDRLRAR